MKHFVALFFLCLSLQSQTLFVPNQTKLTFTFTAIKVTSNTVFTVYQTNALAPVSTSWPVLSTFPASQNIVSTNGTTNFTYSIPVQLQSPALFFTVSVSNQSGMAWCVNPPFCPSDPLLQIGDLTGTMLK